MFFDLRLYGEPNFRNAVGDSGGPSNRVSSWPWSEEVCFGVGLLISLAADALDSVSLLGSMEDELLEAVLVRLVASAAAAPGTGYHVELKLRLPAVDFSKKKLPLS